MKPSQEFFIEVLKIVLDIYFHYCYNSHMKIINNKWTDEEIRQLKREYGIKSTGELAARLNKSPSAVTSKVHYLRRRGWTFNSKRHL